MKTPLRSLASLVAFGLLLIGLSSAYGATVSGPLTELATGATSIGDRLLALSADGTRATAVWAIDDGTNRILQSRSAVIAGSQVTWGATTDVVTLKQVATEVRSSLPQLMLSQDGSTAALVWSQREPSFGWVMQAATATITGNVATWTKPTDLSQPQEWGLGINGALSADGKRLMVTWYRGSDASNASSFLARSATIADGVATWSAVTVLEAGTQHSGAIAATGLSSDGTRATAVWMRYDFTSISLQSKSAVLDGSEYLWGPLTTLTTPAIVPSITGGYMARPVLALSADGKAATTIWAYGDRKAGTDTVIALHGSIDGTKATWAKPVTLMDITVPAGTGSSLGLTTPVLATTPDGTKAFVTWKRFDGTAWNPQYSIETISAGVGTWSAPTAINLPIATTVGGAVRFSASRDLSKVLFPLSPGTDTKRQVEVFEGSFGSALSFGTSTKVGASDLNVQQPIVGFPAQGNPLVLWTVVADKTSLIGAPLTEAGPTPTPTPTPTQPTAAPAKKFKNCLAMNRVFKGGVAKPGAIDKGKKPKFKSVTDLATYTANAKLDRDRDGVACER